MARYHSDAALLDIVEAAVRVQQNSQVAVDYARGYALLLSEARAVRRRLRITGRR